MRLLLEKMVSEDWKSNVAAGLLGATLAASPANASAHLDHHKHRTHHHGIAHKNYSEQDIIHAIAGEAATYDGMLAVADVIRNRQRLPGEYKHNILSGIAGLHAKFLSHEHQSRFDLAKKAWDDSASKNIVGDAYMWGNNSDIQKWKNEKGFDFNKIEFVKNVEGNNFYRYL